MKYFFDNKNRVGSLFILLFSLIYLNLALELPTDPIASDEHFTSKTLPVALAVLTILCCLFKLMLPVDDTNHESISEEVEGYHWKPSILLMIITLIYTLSFDLLGFIVATIALLFLGFTVLKEDNWKTSIIVATCLTMFIWAVLTQLFGLHLSAGDLYYSLMGVA